MTEQRLQANSGRGSKDAVLQKSRGFLISKILPIDERSERDLENLCLCDQLPKLQEVESTKNALLPLLSLPNTDMLSLQPAAIGLKYADYQAPSKISSAYSHESQ